MTVMGLYANRIRERMLAGGLAMVDLASACKVSEKTMRTHINNPEQMPVGELGQLVSELKLTPADLWMVVTRDSLTIRDILQMIV